MLYYSGCVFVIFLFRGKEVAPVLIHGKLVQVSYAALPSSGSLG